MEKLIAELSRLYLAPEAVTRDALAAHLLGKHTLAIKLTTADGLVRALAIPFRRVFGDAETGHWDRLCEVANAMQSELGLPAPAVSIDGASAYRLWLSLETPVPAGEAQEFLEMLRELYFPALELAPDAASAPVYLPPCLNPRSGKWAAFIHPGMGASFAEDSGLDVAPPLAAQIGFLDGLSSIEAFQFRQAREKLEQRRHVSLPQPLPAAVPAPSASEDAAMATAATPRAATLDPGKLRLEEATLEDIARYLLSKNIEPSFRFLPPR